MNDALLMMDIYQRFLAITSDLVTILERNAENDEGSEEYRKKKKEFNNHVQNTIQKFHEDYHILFKLSWELKELDKK